MDSFQSWQPFPGRRQGDWERTGRGVATVATWLAVLDREAGRRSRGTVRWRICAAARPGSGNPRSALVVQPERTRPVRAVERAACTEANHCRSGQPPAGGEQWRRSGAAGRRGLRCFGIWLRPAREPRRPAERCVGKTMTGTAAWTMWVGPWRGFSGVGRRLAAFFDLRQSAGSRLAYFPEIYIASLETNVIALRLLLSR